MKITKVSYGETINRGNYESTRIGLEAEIQEGENYEEALKELSLMVTIQAKKLKKDDNNFDNDDDL